MNLLRLIVNKMNKHYATEIQVLDFRGISSDYDYFVIGSAQNGRLAWALVEYIKEELAKHGYGIKKVEGDHESRWILLDCDAIIVHLFVAEERSIYQLEGLWADIPHVEIDYDLQ